MKQRKAYRRFVIVFLVLTALSFAFFLFAVVRSSNRRNMFLGLALLAVVALVFRALQDRYYLNGYYSAKQASAFLAACGEAGIRSVSAQNLEEAKALYAKTVSNVHFDNDKAQLKLMNDILREARKDQGGKNK